MSPVRKSCDTYQPYREDEVYHTIIWHNPAKPQIAQCQRQAAPVTQMEHKMEQIDKLDA